jgi:protein-disulfide isomerase
MLKKLFASFVILTSLLVSPTWAQDAKKYSPEEKKAIEAIIKDYLINNPKIMLEVQAALQTTMEKERSAELVASIEANREQLENDGVSVVLGNPDADVTVVEFFDYQCGYCRKAHPDVERLLAEDKNVRVVFKQFPILDRPNEVPLSLIAAHMAMAAHKQDKFAEFHDALYKAEGGLSQENLAAIMASVGLDKEKAEAEMMSEEIGGSIRNNMALAQKMGISSTPTFIIGDQVIEGALGYDALKEKVAAARAKNKKQKSD